MSHMILLLTGLMAAKLVTAAVDVAAGHPLGQALTSLGPVEMIVLVQVFMAIAGGMPHPSLLRKIPLTEFAYTWVYNSANIIFQNLEKRYHPDKKDDGPK